jgi:carbon starvation protein
VTLPLLAVLVLAVLVLGYALYGRFVARAYALDDAKATPAVAKEDGVDFVPTKPFYLLGQHFSAIAAAGPIVGPILACTTWGWLPCVLWIALGVVFVGAVHDFTALVASVRHGAGSIAEIARRNLGPRAWIALVAFVWISLVYVVVAFTDVTARTFLGAIEEIPGEVPFHKGGGVAAAAVSYLTLAVLMGVVQRRLSPPTWLLTLVFVPLTLGCVWLGTRPSVSTVLVAGATTWQVAILAYCLVASLLPVSWLLQPRGYLGGFVLYLALAAGVVGIFFGGDGEIRQPAFVAGGDALGTSLFPFLFVTIACGACSGFHGLVCGGTTSKQVAREGHCRPVGYGGMLLEAFVALVALATVLSLSPAESKGLPPARLYGDGIARFLTTVLGADAFRFASIFGAMAFSTFVFDTLDVATRLGRYLLQELFGSRSLAVGFLATLATTAVPLAILLAGVGGAWTKYWVLFGSANQLLAGLTLLSCSVWLKRSGRRCWYTLAPAVVLLAITVTSLAWHAVDGTKALARSGLSSEGINGVVAILLLALAAAFGVEAVRAWRAPARIEGGDAPAAA